MIKSSWPNKMNIYGLWNKLLYTSADCLIRSSVFPAGVPSRHYVLQNVCEEKFHSPCWSVTVRRCAQCVVDWGWAAMKVGHCVLKVLISGMVVSDRSLRCHAHLHCQLPRCLRRTATYQSHMTGHTDRSADPVQRCHYSYVSDTLPKISQKQNGVMVLEAQQT